MNEGTSGGQVRANLKRLLDADVAVCVSACKFDPVRRGIGVEL